VDLDHNGTLELLTYALPSYDLVARRFVRGAPSPALTLWTLSKKGTVLGQQDWAKVRVSSNDTRVLALDVDGDKAWTSCSTSARTLTRARRPRSPRTHGEHKPKPLGVYTLPDGLSLLTFDVFPSVNRPYDQLLVTRSDGYLAILDQDSSPRTWSPTPRSPFRGCAWAATTAGPRLRQRPDRPRLDGTADAVVVTDSRGALLRLNPRPPRSSPRPRWPGRWQGEHADGGGPPGRRRDRLVHRAGGYLYARSADGAELWKRSLPAGMSFDALPGDVNDDQVPDLFVATCTSGSVCSLQVHDGTSGGPLCPARSPR